MRAAGLSLLRLARPVMLFALLVFGLTTWLAQWGAALEFDQSQEGGSQSPPRPAHCWLWNGILRGTDPENDDLRLGEGR
jgi:hypothetical protein